MPTPVVSEAEALLEAVKEGREAKVRALLTGGGRVDVTDGEGRTAFHWACQHGHLHVLCLLLSHVPANLLSVSSHNEGVRVCSACRRSRGFSGVHRSELHVGRLQGQPGALLPRRGDPQHAKDTRSEEEKDFTGDVGHIGDGRSLTSTGSDARSDLCTCHSRPASHVINRRDGRGQTALHVAVNYRRADVASFLVTLPFCQVDTADQAGNTPLHRAVHNGLSTLACLLCDAGADVRAANAQFLTPLHEAIRGADHHVVRTLLARGCDVNAVTKSAAAPTPFLTAVFYYKIATRPAAYAPFLDSTLRLLIEAGCRLSQGDSQWTPLSAAIDIDNSFIASLLLFNGCRVTNTNNYTTTTSSSSRRSSMSITGRSLLVEAFSRCEGHVVRLLVLCGYHPTLEEVDCCSRRIPSFSPLFYRISSSSERAAVRDKAELLGWLRQRTRSPRSLLDASRVAVRAALNGAAGDTSILGRLPGLPLPKVLRDYVGLSDFTEDLQQ
ncbi:uncharacterized protein LOC143300499 [Babylonia areolata]|uniref:uncharacterized protein LOC143300499 n=1 Tax=Babylonia areolata TaxID=304850 RepID=UPI003FD239D0